MPVCDLLQSKSEVDKMIQSEFSTLLLLCEILIGQIVQVRSI